MEEGLPLPPPSSTRNSSEKLRVTADGKVGIGTGATAPLARLQVAGGAIMPAAGNSESAGILFPKNPGGGVGDAAWIRYYVRTGEETTLEIGTANETTDHVAFMASGGVGIGTTTPGAKLDINGGAYLGYETSLTDFGSLLKSGFYQNTGTKVTGDVPDTAHSWSHLITARHSNTANNHQLQIAASYATNDKLYFRKIAATGVSNPTWNELATRGANLFAGDQTVQGTLTVGSNPVRFTSVWSGFPDSTTNQAHA